MAEQGDQVLKGHHMARPGVELTHCCKRASECSSHWKEWDLARESDKLGPAERGTCQDERMQPGGGCSPLETAEEGIR